MEREGIHALPSFCGIVVIMEAKIAEVSPKALERFVAVARREARLKGEVNILLTHDRKMRELNRRFRRKDKTTDVLSFPSLDGGDIAISVPLAKQNARALGHGVGDELKILILHGTLHLKGHDHEADDGAMARLERRLRKKLALPISLIERAEKAR
jgi:probable rRNA maturation factor